ncbi:MAG TPA: hypothetical protein VLA42_17080 [Verrucomicrobiae bacterium]|jgi:hypothetical protein|nr:hypothetical protein [Verrucomicrobiae bacterium]
MTSNAIWRTAIRSGFILSVLTTTYSCNFKTPETAPKTANNLTYVQCNPNGINVPVTAPGSVPLAYEYIFVCAGNPVEWFTDDDFKFTVDFDPSATDLFESKKTHLDSAPDPTGKHKHAIKGQKVSDHAKKLLDHSYCIHPQGTPVSACGAPSDPHVIPM